MDTHHHVHISRKIKKKHLLYILVSLNSVDAAGQAAVLFYFLSENCIKLGSLLQQTTSDRKFNFINPRFPKKTKLKKNLKKVLTPCTSCR